MLRLKPFNNLKTFSNFFLFQSKKKKGGGEGGQTGFLPARCSGLPESAFSAGNHFTGKFPASSFGIWGRVKSSPSGDEQTSVSSGKLQLAHDRGDAAG